MDEVGSLIERFEAETASRKVSVLRELEERAGDERVWPFLMKVAADEAEYDLARIEALKIMGLKEGEDEEVDRQIGQVIQRILAADPDDDVRNYAATAASRYVEVGGVLEELEKIVLDPDEDVDIRWSAFASVEEMGPTNQSKKIMNKALRDEVFKDYTERVLKTWQV
ncbi:MAG TPA: hypothetical protein VGV38_21190 [Pyrinomonadaceae bacterium]|nr:hypothetical protein [Pyrinomonadaceae bacterium]